ncbi:hypothetical protein [Microbulbifer zhoushanensis]|uniref:hypothetical protein n=1 Tax=Microbulbifer zhoushanensis TaxID=2904254 RepID=UPI001F3754A1|nr:hypothetical protein [Microbulbifer zhoushanensis]
MYELPNESHLRELIGQEVNLVSVGPYDAQIGFEKGVVIQSLHKLEGEVNGIKSVWFDGEWVSTKDLVYVPNKEVTGISNENELVLKITLTGGVALYIHTEVSQYESINITRTDGTIEVI